MKELFPEIDFADSECEALEWKNGDLTIYLKTWNETSIEIVFEDAIQYIFKLGDGISGFFINNKNSDFFEEAIARCFTTLPAEIPYKHYVVTDINKFPFIEIIASGVRCTKSEGECKK